MKDKKTIKSAIIGFVAVFALIMIIDILSASFFGTAYLYWPLLIVGVVLGAITAGIIIFLNSRKKGKAKD